MKKILTIIMIILSFNSFAQTTDDGISDSNDSLTSVGDGLINFDMQYKNGVTIKLTGYFIVIIGSVIFVPPLIITGGILTILGDAVSANSHKHIRNAGLLMNYNHIGINLKKIKIKN